MRIARCHWGTARAGRAAAAALAAVAWIASARPAGSVPKRPDDRVSLPDGGAVDAADATLSREQVAAIRRSVYALRPKIGLGVGPACTGTAISETLLLTAGHCAIHGGMRAYQKHLRPRPHSVDLELVRREMDKRTGADIALFERKAGRFPDHLPVDPSFDFASVAPGDQFGFPAFPYVKWKVRSWPQTALLYSPVSRSRDGDREMWFDLEPCRGSGDGEPGTAGPPAVCRVRFRAVFYDGNSGSPMLRIRGGEGREAISVVAVGTTGARPTAPDGSLGSVAAPVSLLRDVLAGATPPPR